MVTLMFLFAPVVVLIAVLLMNAVQRPANKGDLPHRAHDSSSPMTTQIAPHAGADELMPPDQPPDFNYDGDNDSSTRKELGLPPDIARSFVEDMHAFHAEKDSLKRDEIAARQIHVLRQYQAKNDQPIELHEVKQMFREMKDGA